MTTTEAAAAVPGLGRWPLALRSLRHRDFRRFWMALLISVCGTWMQNVTQAWLVWQLTEQPIYSGLVGMCNSLPMLVLGAFTGVLADRVSKHRLVFVTQLLASGQAFVLAALVYTGVVQVWHVMVLATTLGCINAFDMPARQAMVMDLVGREDLFNAISLNSSAFNSGRFVGPALAGLLVAKAGMAVCFFVNAFSFLPLVVVLLTLRPQYASALVRGAFREQLRDGMRWVTGHEVARALMALIAVSAIFAMPYAVLLPMYADAVLGVGPGRYGLLMAAHGLGALMTALSITWRGHRVRLGAAVTAGTFIAPAGLLLLSGAPSYGAALACLFVTGIGMMCFNMIANTILQKAPPTELRGRVMGLRSLVFVGLMPFGSLQIGSMAQAFGARAALAMGAIVCLVAAALVAWRVPHLRRTHL